MQILKFLEAADIPVYQGLSIKVGTKYRRVEKEICTGLKIVGRLRLPVTEIWYKPVCICAKVDK